MRDTNIEKINKENMQLLMMGIFIPIIIIGVIITAFFIHGILNLENIKEATLKDITEDEIETLVRCLDFEYIPNDIKFVTAKYKFGIDSTYYYITFSLDSAEAERFKQLNNFYNNYLILNVVEENDNFAIFEYSVRVNSASSDKYDGFVDIVDKRDWRRYVEE